MRKHGTTALAVAVVFLLAIAVGSARQAKTAPAQSNEAPKTETWVGKISDAHCGAGKHTMGTPEECVTGCVKNGQYVFVGDKDKIFKIENQKLADLAKFAGKPAEITGTAKGDTITVAKIAAPKK